MVPPAVAASQGPQRDTTCPERSQGRLVICPASLAGCLPVSLWGPSTKCSQLPWASVGMQAGPGFEKCGQAGWRGSAAPRFLIGLGMPQGAPRSPSCAPAPAYSSGRPEVGTSSVWGGGAQVGRQGDERSPRPRCTHPPRGGEGRRGSPELAGWAPPRKAGRGAPVYPGGLR